MVHVLRSNKGKEMLLYSILMNIRSIFIRSNVDFHIHSKS